MKRVFKKFFKLLFNFSLFLTVQINLMTITNASSEISTNSTNTIENYQLKYNYTNSKFFNNICSNDIVNREITTKSNLKNLIEAMNKNNEKQGIFKVLDLKNNKLEIFNLKNKYCSVQHNKVWVEYCKEWIDEKNDFFQCFEVKQFEKMNEFLNPTYDKKGLINGINYGKLKRYDRIVAVNGKKIANLTDFERNDLINELKTNQNLDIDFLRPVGSNKFQNMKYYSHYANDLSKFGIDFRCLSVKNNNEENGEPAKTFYINFKNNAINYNTASDFNEELTIIKRQKNVKNNLVIDLRNCEGGNFAAARKMACYLLPKNKVYMTIKNINSDFGGMQLNNLDKPILPVDETSISVLVNEKTADAALQLATILKSCANATIYGKQPHSKNIEYRGVDIYEDDNLDKAFGFLMFPKIVYNGGLNYNFNNLNTIKVDYICECDTIDQVSQILNSIVLKKTIDYHFSKEDLNKIQAEQFYIRDIIKKQHDDDIITDKLAENTITKYKELCSNFNNNPNKNISIPNAEDLSYNERFFLMVLAVIKHYLNNSYQKEDLIQQFFRSDSEIEAAKKILKDIDPLWLLYHYRQLYNKKESDTRNLEILSNKGPINYLSFFLSNKFENVIKNNKEEEEKKI